ncbi:hypothetical protein [Paenibacillus guangzhouensis]|uniref:hypothetical protein n=1 Tax=Paenibacillus guangzhouensis TaxID=1473112 RepID=UPI001266D738|nr:hypothetical protein [Paenibacillus guangzhouensis]
MQNTGRDISEQVYRFIYDDISFFEIETWFYNIISNYDSDKTSPFFNELITFNFRQKDAKNNLKSLLKEVWLKTYSEEITYERIRRVLRDIINEAIPVNQGCRELSGLYFSGYDFIPYDFDGYLSEMLDIPLPIEYKFGIKMH